MKNMQNKQIKRFGRQKTIYSPNKVPRISDLGVQVQANALNSLMCQTQYKNALESIDSFEFDALALSEAVQRQNAFSLGVLKMILNLRDIAVPVVDIELTKLKSFLMAIQNGYRQEVQYHNDLHGLDVAQMMFLMIKQGKLTEIAQLNYLDLLAAMTAAACHDFDHDGFNNGYHVNFMTNRAIRYHDKAVQENWHALKGMKQLLVPEQNYIDKFSLEAKLIFRRRFISMILATDMADHMSHLNFVEFKIKNKQISQEKNNGHLFVEAETEKEKFSSQ